MVRRTLALFLCAASLAAPATADDGTAEDLAAGEARQKEREARAAPDAEPVDGEKAEPVEETVKFDYMDSDTWSRPAQVVFMIIKFFAAFTPVWVILWVLMSAWEDEEEEKLKRSKKSDFTFDSPE